MTITCFVSFRLFQSEQIKLPHTFLKFFSHAASLKLGIKFCKRNFRCFRFLKREIFVDDNIKNFFFQYSLKFCQYRFKDKRVSNLNLNALKQWNLKSAASSKLTTILLVFFFKVQISSMKKNTLKKKRKYLKYFFTVLYVSWDFFRGLEWKFIWIYFPIILHNSLEMYKNLKRRNSR